MAIATLFGASRLLAAALSPISDCDETYNYWEPTHYVMYGSGFQTWEYSPVYAIRSYAYLLLHALIGYPIELLTHNKVLVFFAIRAALALFCGFSEYKFYKAIKRNFASPFVATAYAVFAIFSTGMFISSAAFLPSAMAMCLMLHAFAHWLNGLSTAAVPYVALSTLLAWPFSAALGVPIALAVMLRRGLSVLLLVGLASLLVILLPLVSVDAFYYGKIVVAPLNILLYNVFSSATSSQLYGVEPWYFYLLNLALNFNIATPLALISPVALLLPAARKHARRTLALLSPLWIWLSIFTLQPHKEERFMFPVYPLLALAAAVSLQAIHAQLARFTPLKQLASGLVTLTLVVFVLLSLSRSASLFAGFAAPMQVYAQVPAGPAGQRVCVGKEWYRFPSNFLLPHGTTLSFIKSEFSGQLPAHFSAAYGTRRAPPHFNDLNREQLDRYVDVDTCDYLVDLASSNPTELEPRYDLQPNWTKVFCASFLDASATPLPDRALFIPFRRGRVVTREYCLLRRVAAGKAPAA